MNCNVFFYASYYIIQDQDSQGSLELQLNLCASPTRTFHVCTFHACTYQTTSVYINFFTHCIRSMTKNNELCDSMRFMQVNSRRRNLNPSPKRIQDSRRNPQNKVNTVAEPEISSQLTHDLDIPIAIRKDTRECTKHPLYPLAKFVLFKKFSSSHSTFLVSLNTIHIPNTLFEALFDEKWKDAMR